MADDKHPWYEWQQAHWTPATRLQPLPCVAVVPANDTAKEVYTVWSKRSDWQALRSRPADVPMQPSIVTGIFKDPAGVQQIKMVTAPAFKAQDLHSFSRHVHGNEDHVANLESYVWPVWNDMRVYCGEQYTVVTKVHATNVMEAGDTCTPLCFKKLAKKTVWCGVEKALQSILPVKETLMGQSTRHAGYCMYNGQDACDPGSHEADNENGMPRDAVNGLRTSVSAALKYLFERWVLQHGIRKQANQPIDEVYVPYVKFKGVTGEMANSHVPPVPFIQQAGNGDVMSMRLQVPLVTSAVRTSNAMLSHSVTPGEQRIILVPTRIVNVHTSAEYHNAVAAVALTRCKRLADFAYAGNFELPDHVLNARLPLRRLGNWAHSRPFVELLHVVSAREGQPPDNADIDALHHEQVQAGFFAAGEPVPAINFDAADFQ
jgi:hypothetical protein